jgi:hypothetical protein
MDGDTFYDSDPSVYVPVDSAVSDVLGQNDPLFGQIDDTLSTLHLYDGADYSPVDDLAPVLGDTETLGQVISGVLDDPNATLSPDTEDWLQHEIRFNGYWNNYLGGLEAGRDIQQGAIDDIRHHNDQVALHNRIYELYDLINDHSNEINSWPNVSGGYGPTYTQPPWPNY